MKLSRNDRKTNMESTNRNLCINLSKFEKTVNLKQIIFCADLVQNIYIWINHFEFASMRQLDYFLSYCPEKLVQFEFLIKRGQDF